TNAITLNITLHGSGIGRYPQRFPQGFPQPMPLKEESHRFLPTHSVMRLITPQTARLPNDCALLIHPPLFGGTPVFVVRNHAVV
ncbi:MAG: hypothetical protein ACRBB0_01975, partial [Pelagimonas sp.]|uniref:hypothetical protein n=1 Tax=Pelagimonas sp. TaxID=2073170 RepID=UPI003D6B3A98